MPAKRDLIAKFMAGRIAPVNGYEFCFAVNGDKRFTDNIPLRQRGISVLSLINVLAIQYLIVDNFEKSFLTGRATDQ